jgi:hypothetical protein
VRLVVVVALLCLPVTPLDAQNLWALDEILRIGAMEGESALSFIGPLALSGDGRTIAVSQPMERSILLLNTATGERQRVLGRAGSGPGEFQQIGGISIVGDTLVAVDARQSRIVRFSLSTGAHIGTDRYHPQIHAETGRVAWPRVRTPDGSYWASPLMDMAQVATGRIRELPILIVTPDGDVIREIARRNVAGSIGSISVGGRIVQFIQPLVKPTLFEYAPDGSTAGLAEPLADRRGEAGWKRVVLFDHHGNVLFDRIYRSAPVPVTQEVQDSLVDWLASIAGRGGHTVAARPAVVRELVVPRHYPAVQRLLVGDDRSVWIQGPGPPGARPTWTVLDPYGAEIARVVSPADVELRLVSPNAAWGVQTDPLGVEYLVQYRIRR